MSQTQGWVPFQMKGTDVAWLCATSRVFFEEYNFDYMCPFFVYNILFGSLRRD